MQRKKLVGHVNNPTWADACMCLALKKSQLPDTLCGAIAEQLGMAIALF